MLTRPIAELLNISSEPTNQVILNGLDWHVGLLQNLATEIADVSYCSHENVIIYIRL